MRKTSRLAGAFGLACAIAGIAAGDPRQDRAAVAKLEEMYAPIGALTGAERVNRACADATGLQQADSAFSDEKAPAGAGVDDAGWARRAGSVESSLSSLVAVCQAPDRKRKLINTVETADEIVAALDADLRALFDAAKTRVLPPALARFRSTLAVTKVPSKAFCRQLRKLAKQVSGFATPPTGADAAAWKSAYDAVKASVVAMQCSKSPEPDEVNASGMWELGEALDALVMLVPPT